jgi:hypothetical protein
VLARDVPRPQDGERRSYQLAAVAAYHFEDVAVESAQFRPLTVRIERTNYCSAGEIPDDRQIVAGRIHCGIDERFHVLAGAQHANVQLLLGERLT